MGSFLESVFQFLFKYRPVVFERGQLAFGAGWSPALAIGFIVAAGVLAVGSYTLIRGGLSWRDRAVLVTVRFIALVVLVFCLARPMLVVATVVPQQNYLGILIDDSKSMRIAEADSISRGATAADLTRSDHPVMKELAERFKLRFFRFSETVERLGGPQELTFSGAHTDLGQALDGARRELAAVPLAGLVVFTDGADNAAGLNEPVLQLQASRTPVHVVGLGRERFDRDLELSIAQVPRTALKGSTVAADLSISHSGLAGQKVTLDVEDGGRLIASREVTLPREGELAPVRMHFAVAESGARRYRFRVRPLPGEMIPQNNERRALIVVEDRSERILYFEGEPRFEVKFLRRAIAADSNVHVVTLQRTAENKFLRLDVSDSTEVAGGFPRTRAELFRYRGLILGSVEASFFTLDQLRMIAEFVSVRGGGLLVLGGRHAFSEGGYAESPLADVLPVVLHAPAARTDSSTFFSEVKVGLTQLGKSHPALQLAAEAVASEQRWNTLPALSTVNVVTEAKPGASVLLRGNGDRGTPYVVLAYQRYGRGKAVAFAIQDSWLWQMHADIPLEDLTHETLWRQMLRWLVSGVPEHVAATPTQDRVDIHRPMTLTAEVSDSGYLRVNGADVVATIISPAGTEKRVPLEWSVARDGEYRGTFAPDEEGLHEVRVEARRGATSLGTSTTFVEAGDVGAEYFGAQMRAPLLRRLAEETGGHFYTPASVGTLPEDVSFTESGATVREERSLWDMPVLLLVLVAVVATEWAYRRSRGLA